MKMNSKTILYALIFALLMLAQSASAFYDASLGRWINRDPLSEPGFEMLSEHSQRIHAKKSFKVELSPSTDTPNLYCFVENRPTTEFDSFGLFLGFGYGNWCGYSRSGQFGDPIDAVDQACKDHDYCLATPADACKLKFCNVQFCSDVAQADCKGDKACKRAKRKILTGCFIIVPIPPFIVM